MATIQNKTTKETATEFNFDNGAWVKVDTFDEDVNENGADYEYMVDDDEETYISGCLEFDSNVLIGFDGCYELPQEVVTAVADLGYQIDDIFNE